MINEVPISPETGQLLALRRAARGLSFDVNADQFHAGRPVPGYLVPSIRALIAAGALRVEGTSVLVTVAGQALRDQLDARRRTLIAAQRGRRTGDRSPTHAFYLDASTPVR